MKDERSSNVFYQKYYRMRIVALCVSLLFCVLFSFLLIQCFFTEEVVQYKEYVEVRRVETYI